MRNFLLLKVSRALSGILLIFCFEGFAQSSTTISGTLISKEDSSPVGFASILDITSYKLGTTSKEDGSFSINMPLEAKGNTHVLMVECIGFKNFEIDLRTYINNSIIKLTPEVYQLPEVVVTPGVAPVDKHIGIVDGEAIGAVIPNSSAGFSKGIFVKINKKEKGPLTGIDLYLAKQGFPQTPFTIRISRIAR